MDHDTHLGVMVREADELPPPEPDSTETSPGTAGINNSTTPVPMEAGDPISPCASNETRPDINSMSNDRESGASSHCSRHGHPHATIHETREEPQEGPRPRAYSHCGHEFSPRPHTRVSPLVSESGSDVSSSTLESRNDTKGATGISYGIQYMASDGTLETWIPWHEPLHLDSVQPETAEAPKERLLRFDTVLVNSKPSDGTRQYGRQRLRARNPYVGFWLYSTQAVILSRKFVEALRGLVSYYPAVSLEGPELKLNEPYSILAHHLDSLEALSSKLSSSNSESSGSEIPQHSQDGGIVPDVGGDGTCQQVSKILEFLKENVWKDFIYKEKARYAQKPSVCTFPMLWLLYKPGDTVYAEADGKPAAYVISRIKVDRSSLRAPYHKQRKLRLSLWYLDYAGKHIGKQIRRHERVVEIAPFAGERQVAALRVIPCRFLDDVDSGKTKRMLEEEGRHWYRLLQTAQVRYTGETLGTMRKWIDERVIVDCAAYWEENAAQKDSSDNDSTDSTSTASDVGDQIHIGCMRPIIRRRVGRSSDQPALIDDVGVTLGPCPCEECRGQRRHVPHNFKWAQYDLIDPTKEDNLELPDSPEGPLHRYLLSSRRLKGFRLKTRQWVTLDVANCRDPEIERTAIENLVMNRDQKDMIKALVHRYATEEQAGHHQPGDWNADFIESKGEGRIFLLHGSPGVGKTYTAECIAEFTGRPLLSLTCGDLGNDETELERQLSRWFGFAERWGAVMLLDEADVYTERRELADMRRNSMVSVFLRCMEYYRGILFLTTNRVGVFDDAFVSRIHVVLHYADLDESQRRQIWEQFFVKLARERRKDICITKRAKDYVFEDPEIRGVKWNGREIRNAFQTAVALAEFEHAKREDKEPGERAELRRDHLEQVCDVALRFKDYLKEVHGLDESQRAGMSRVRAQNIQKRALP